MEEALKETKAKDNILPKIMSVNQQVWNVTITALCVLLPEIETLWIDFQRMAGSVMELDICYTSCAAITAACAAITDIQPFLFQINT